ncbi:MAG: hypothetical protein ACI4D4_04515 [Lachnospira sp.]
MSKNVKSMLSVSERDKKLLVYVFAVLIVVMAYMFGYQKLAAVAENNQRQVTELTKKKRDLTEKNNNKGKYVSDTLDFQSKSKKLLTEYENGSSQTSVLSFLNKIESSTGAWVKSVTFSEPVAVYTFGQKTSSNPSDSSAVAYSTDKVGYKVTIDVAYDADYTQWKNLIKYINDYDTKNSIEAITVSYSEATNTVSGTMSLALYSVTGEGRKFEEPKFDIGVGTGNIFSNQNDGGQNNN